MTRKGILVFFIALFSQLSFGQNIILWDTTVTMQNSEFKFIAGRSQSDTYAQIIKNFNDTLTIIGVNGNIEIKDFNLDGLNDVYFTYLGNVSFGDLYLFDRYRENFIEIKGMREYSEFQKLNKHENIYYSHRRAGCADMNWISHLFIIENESARTLGIIYGQGCTTLEEPTKIEVFKGNSTENKFLIETIPYEMIENYIGYKWGFVSFYWENNYEKFKN